MKNKKRNFLLIWILALALLLNVLAFVPVVAQGGRDLAVELEDYDDFTYTASYKIDDGDDVKEIGEEISLDGLSSLVFHLDFDIPDEFPIEKGDYFDIDLSGLSKIVGEAILTGSERIDFVIAGNRDSSAAKYSVISTEDDPKLKLHIEFDNDLDYLNTTTGRSAYVEFSFDILDKGTDIREEIEVPVSKTENKTFTVLRTLHGTSSISKSAKEYQPGSGKIVWIIDVNTVLDDLTDVSIIDTLPRPDGTGAPLEVEKVEIYSLEVTTEGIDTTGEPIVLTPESDNGAPTYQSEDGKLTVELGHLKKEAKRIIVTTKLTEGTGTHNYKNEVKLHAKKDENVLQVEADFTVAAGSEGLSKLAREGNSPNEIVWEIKYIGDGETTKITDTLTLTSNNDDSALKYISLFFDKDSVNVNGNKFPFNEDDGVVTVSSSDGGLKIEFSGLPTEDGTPYTITYSTHSFFSGIGTENYTVSNNAVHEKHGEATKEESFSKNAVIEKEFAEVRQEKIEGKLHTYIDWEITINPNGEVWKNVVIKETIPEGFKFIEAKRGTTKLATNPTLVTDTDTEIEITVVTGDNKTLEEPTTITVTTELTNPGLEPLDGEDNIIGYNEARVKWNLAGDGYGEGNGIGDGPGFGEDIGGGYSETFRAPITKKNLEHKLTKTPNDIAIESPTEGKAHWKLDYKTYTSSIPFNLVIKDSIDTSEDPHTYDSGSFKLIINGSAEIDLSADGEGLKPWPYDDGEATLFSYKLSINNDKKSFELTIVPGTDGDSGNVHSDLFNKDANHIVLTYDTIVDFTNLNDVAKNVLKNKAYVIAGILTTPVVSASQSFPKPFSRNGVKSVKDNNDRTYTWTAKLNYKSKTISAEETIIDTLSKGQVYVASSLNIYEAKLTTGYDLEKVKVDGKDVLLGSDVYTVSFTPEGDSPTQMVITFTEALDHPIIIEYQTKAVGIAKETYNNELTYNGMEYSSSVTRENYDEFIDKELLNGRGTNGNLVVLGDVLDWEIDVNESLSEIYEFVLTDELSQGLVLIPDSVEVYKDDDKIAPVENSTTEDGFVIEETPNGFTLSKDLVDERYTVKYKTLVIAAVGVNKISNTVKIESGEWQTIITSKDYDIVSASSAGGTGRVGDRKLTVIKVDKDDVPISSPAEFKLTIITKIGENTYMEERTFTTGMDGSFVAEITPNDWTEYSLKETEAPAGYILNDEPIQIDFGDGNVELKIKNKAILKVNLEAEKTLQGQALLEGQFEFKLSELKEQGEEPDLTMTASNDENGNVTFKNIEFEEAGTYWFKIVEHKDVTNPAFMTYDNAEYFAKVVVEDLVDSETEESLFELTESISYYKGGTDKENRLGEGKVAEFTNTYEASGSFTASFKKSLDGGGRKIENKEFTFVLTPVGDAPLRTSVEDESASLTVETTNDGVGKLSFELFFNQDDLALEPSKEFQYTVKEIDLYEDGMEYSETVYIITVTVEDNRQGNLIVTATYEAGEGTSGVFDDENGTPIFTNIYEASGEWSPKVTKKLFGRGLRNEEFTFTLYTLEGQIYPTAVSNEDVTWPLTAKNNASGVVAFEPIKFTEDDIGETFEYIIREVNPTPSEGGMRYDENEYKVSVLVEDAGDGELKFTTAYYLRGETPEQEWETLTDDGITFRNIYSAGNAWTPNVTKELVGRELKDKEFEFVLKGPQGNVIEKVKNDADGNVVFSSIGFSEADIGGSYTYTIEEVVGSEPGMSYDTRSIKINVSISDAGGGVLNINASYPAVTTFVNRYSGPSGITVTANKVWKDLPSGWTTDLPTIWFKLYRSVEGKTAEAVPGLALQKLPAGVTQVSWNGLEKYDPDGKLYVYSVKEVDENGKDYEPKYFEKTENGLTVTNAFIKERVDGDEDFETEIDVTGHKVWKGVPKGQTVPTIWLKLYRHIEGGTPVAVAGRPIMELPPGVTQGTWKELEKVDENYNYYIYSVKEVDNKGKDYEPPHFRKTEEGLTVTNTHTAGAPVTGETLSVYTIMGAMLMALAALFLILTGRKRAKAK